MKQSRTGMLAQTYTTIWTITMRERHISMMQAHFHMIMPLTIVFDMKLGMFIVLVNDFDFRLVNQID
jgi:hypothetical protein